MKSIKLPHWMGKFDHASVVLPGLFCSLNRKGGQRHQPFHIEHVFEGSNTRMIVRASERLGVDDLKVFQGLVGVATEASRTYCNALKDYEEGRCKQLPAIASARANCAMPELSRACGYGGSRSTTGYESIRTSIRRLASTIIQFIPMGGSAASRAEPFLTIHRLDDGAPSVVDVGFHSRLNSAILAARKDEHYVKVNLDEARRLTKDAPRLLHHRLSFLNEGRKDGFRPATLENYVWSEDDAATSAGAEFYRSDAVRAALEALNGIGWKVAPDESGQLVHIRRPRDERSNPLARDAGSPAGFRSGRMSTAQSYRFIARNIT